MASAHRSGLGWLVGIGLVAASCSLSSLDDLTRNDVQAGTCERGVQCSGCTTCASSCDCVVASDVVQCILSCQGSAGGGAGTGAGAGGSWPLDGATDAAGGSSGIGSGGVSGGTSCVTGDTQFCATCCEEKAPGGSQGYSDTIELCICGPDAPCEQACAQYCIGGALGDCATCLETQEANDCTAAHCDAACQEFNVCYYDCAT